jgi:hypothetical protein
MTAWREHEHIDFDFFDAHDLNTARDSSLPETIRRRLTDRLANTKQVVMLIGDVTRRKAANADSFLYHEVRTIKNLGLPIVFANLDQSREVQRHRIPEVLLDEFTVSVSFQAKIIKYALDGYVEEHRANKAERDPAKKIAQPRLYNASVYTDLGL